MLNPPGRHARRASRRAPSGPPFRPSNVCPRARIAERDGGWVEHLGRRRAWWRRHRARRRVSSAYMRAVVSTYVSLAISARLGCCPRLGP
eukprot:5855261-Pleurochrysis_carterae.AAC.1